jgi:hypothetical protein
MAPQRPGSTSGDEAHGSAVARWAGAVEEWLLSHGVAATVLVTAFVLIEQWWSFGRRGLPYDWPSASAGIALVLTLPIGLRVAAESHDVIERLARRHVLEGPSAELLRELDEDGRRWSTALGWVGGLGLPVLLVAVWGSAARELIVVLAAVGGLLAGRVIGALVATSRLGRVIEDGPWRIGLQPGHVDGAAGLRPVGDHFFRQAMVLAVPALWLAVRLSLPVFPLEQWRSVYVGLLVLVVALEVVAFVAPMTAFHRIMRHEKRELLLRADGSSAELDRLEQLLQGDLADEERDALADRVSRIRENYDRVERLPTWPVATEVRRRFTVRNVLLLTPAALNLVGLAFPDAGLWAGLVDVFEPG